MMSHYLNSHAFPPAGHRVSLSLTVSAWRQKPARLSRRLNISKLFVRKIKAKIEKCFLFARAEKLRAKLSDDRLHVFHRQPAGSRSALFTNRHDLSSFQKI